MASRTLEIADMLTEDLERFLKAFLPGTTVTRTYTPFIDDDAFEAAVDAAKSMLVFVVPFRKASTLDTRDKDARDYTFGILFVEKCTEAGLPNNEWMDLRMDAVESAEDKFGDIRTVWPDNSDLRAQESEIDFLFDADEHAESSVFWSRWTLTLREHA